MFSLRIPSPLPPSSEQERSLPTHDAPSDAAGSKTVLLPFVSAGLF